MTICHGLLTSCRPERDRQADPEGQSHHLQAHEATPIFSSFRQRGGDAGQLEDRTQVCVLVAEEREGSSFSSLSHKLRDSPPLLPCLCSWASSKWNFPSRLPAARRPLLVCVERGRQVLLRQQCWGGGLQLALKTACWGRMRGWGRTGDMVVPVPGGRACYYPDCHLTPYVV